MAPEAGLALELVREVLERGDPLIVHSRGWSMGRTVPAGTRVHLHRPQRGSIATGDIIVYEVDRRLVGHRVVEQWRCGKAAWFLTRGDGHRLPDPPLREDRVLARVVGLETEEGKPFAAECGPGAGLLVRAVALAWRLCQWMRPVKEA